MAYKKFTASEDMLKPDARFNSKLVAKFINCLMWQGKKTVAQKVFYTAMDQVKEKVKDAQPLEVFEQAINNVRFQMQVPTAFRPRSYRAEISRNGGYSLDKTSIPSRHTCVDQ